MSDPKAAAAEVNFLDLPDDELHNHVPPEVVVAAAAEGEDTPDTDEVAAEAGNTEGAASGGSPAEVDDEAEEEKVAPVVEDKAPVAAKKAVAPKVEAEVVAEVKPEVPAVTVDYKAEYDRMMAPFKANGKDIAVANVDDAISLMQMGANYNKKMAALKPNLALLKMLENNGLLSEEKIGYLIDLTKKDPGAINKLVKDSGLDPMDLDAEKAAAYKPAAHKVDARELELDAVLDELQTTPSYARTIEIVSKEWDGPSKQVIADSPQLLKVINQHVQAGIYDRISTEVERERMFGRLQGLSDLEAYRQVGDAIQARGGFNHLEPAKAGAQGKPNDPAVVVVTPDTSKEEAAKDKKRAAGLTKPVATASAPKDFNPLSMSDEEFAKVKPQYA
jgi:hypothetical protein